jgi:transcriptional regulator with XRE-family HTH domain
MLAILRSPLPQRGVIERSRCVTTRGSGPQARPETAISCGGRSARKLSVVILSGSCRGSTGQPVAYSLQKGESLVTVNPEGIVEARLLVPAELADIVKSLREANKWTQETLAALAGVTDRTIQRVENGEPSSLDTRRALAKAFEFEDLDVFEKPWPFPNVEKLRTYCAELDKTTVVIPLTRIRDGRTLRTMVEGAESSATEELGEISSGGNCGLPARLQRRSGLLLHESTTQC